MSTLHGLRRGAAASTAAAVAWAGLALVPGQTANAEPLPENSGDVGVYTNGTSDPFSIGQPVYTNVTGVPAALAPGVAYTADSMHEKVFEKDLAAGGTDYYLDRILGVTGDLYLPILQTRGRSLYMRNIDDASFTRLGFAGNAFAGGPHSMGDFYTVDIDGQNVSEQSAQRFNAPSHASTVYDVGNGGVTAKSTKLITYDNVALNAITLTNPGGSAVTYTVNAASPNATKPATADDELTGTRVLKSGANNGLVDTPWDTVTIGLKGTGFTRDGAQLTRQVTVPAGGSTTITLVGYLGSETLPDSEASFREYAALSGADAVKKGITDFNRRYADEVPYINVPDPAVEKAIVYRWWGERYNVLDANAPGQVYQYPTTVEGSHLYQNSIALTQPMHLQDTKWLRTPYLPYGQILNIGELSGSSAFLDSPGHTSWNNHYSQYIGTAGLEAYNVHGGGAAIAERFARYFEGDAVGQLEHYDGDGDKLIAYDSNNMPGNDADAISFGYPRDGGTAGSATIERPESAYVWGAFDAARQLYDIAGNSSSKVTEMASQANQVRSAILDNLWSPSMKMFLSETSYGATASRSSNGGQNPLPTSESRRIPAKESNMYDVYAENLIPADQAADYVDGYRFLTYGDNFPIFPFYTANQYDREKFGIGGSNNFSNINFTVQYRAVRAALRTYDPNQKYMTPTYARRLLDWMAWSIYPEGDLRTPNQAEYYSNWNPTTKTYGRNNPYHVMLGNMNYAYIEDMGGIQPRSDGTIALSPIDLGYDNFMVNNLRYHNRDLTIVWDKDGTKYDLGTGYSLFIDGEKVVTVDKLDGFTYDPTTNTVSTDPGVTVTFKAAQGQSFPTAKGTTIDDDRVTDYLKTAGIDLTQDAPNLVTSAALSSSATQSGTRPTPWAEFHTPGLQKGPNYTPGAITTTERPVSLAAVKDGSTVNEPYWGNWGTSGSKGYVQLDFGSATSLDNVRVWFVSDRHEGGYQEPSRFYIEIPDGSGGWKPLTEQAKSSTRTLAGFNEVLFPAMSTDKIRVSFDNSPGNYTAISEIQAFASGRPIPSGVNQAPEVTIERTDAGNGNLRANLAGTVVDDGAPYDKQLTYGWSIVSKPAGATADLSTPGALTTVLQADAAGDYVVQLSASDGTLTTAKELTVSLAPRDTVVDFGKTASSIVTSGSSPWENPDGVNDDGLPDNSSPGAGVGWGTYGQEMNGSSAANAATIEYRWNTPVRMTSTDIYWYNDGGGISLPKADSWVVESSDDGTTWTAVTLTNGSTYAGALQNDKLNKLTFEPVVAKRLRIRIFGSERGDSGSPNGIGVLRWRASGDTITSLRSPVQVRTTKGVAPTLPSEIDAVFADGTRGTMPVTWPEIDPSRYAEANSDPFIVNGTNENYGQLVRGEVYVRNETADGGITIVGAEQFEQTIAKGAQPTLPTRVAVSYNDGSRDNQAIGVTWRYDPSVTAEDGVYTIIGDLVLPSYVGRSGVTTTQMKLTVGDGGGTTTPTPTPTTPTTPITPTTPVPTTPVTPATPAAPVLLLKKVEANKKKGTAVLRLTTSAGSTVSLSGKGVRPAKAAAGSGTTVKVKVRASGAKLKTLKRTGKVRVVVTITATSASGVSTVVTRKVKLVRR